MPHSNAHTHTQHTHMHTRRTDIQAAFNPHQARAMKKGLTWRLVRGWHATVAATAAKAAAAADVDEIQTKFECRQSPAEAALTMMPPLADWS